VFQGVLSRKVFHLAHGFSTPQVTVLHHRLKPFTQPLLARQFRIPRWCGRPITGGLWSIDRCGCVVGARADCRGRSGYRRVARSRAGCAGCGDRSTRAGCSPAGCIPAGCEISRSRTGCRELGRVAPGVDRLGRVAGARARLRWCGGIAGLQDSITCQAIGKAPRV
jgi:hypothetical protein